MKSPIKNRSVARLALVAAAAIVPLVLAGTPAEAATGTTTLYSASNYGGSSDGINAGAQGVNDCHNLGSGQTGTESVANNSTGTFYIYAGSGCTGSAEGIAAHSSVGSLASGVFNNTHSYKFTS